MRTEGWMRGLRVRWRAMFRREAVEQELDEELRYHVERKTEENVAKGMSAEEARRAARIELGGIEQVKEQVRAARAGAWMGTVAQDTRFGLRMLRKNAGFTAVAVLTLALGIGANTAMFSLTDQVLLRFLPVTHPEQLVIVRSPGPNLPGYSTGDGDSAEIFSYPMYQDLRDHNPAFSGLLARSKFLASVAGRDGSEPAQGELVSGNYFDVLGVGPALGRVFTAGDETAPGANPVVVLSYGYWRGHFGGDPGILNKPLIVSETPLTIVGVSRAGFSGVQVGQEPDIFVPITMKKQMMPSWKNVVEDRRDRRNRWVAILGRLKPGFTRTTAEAAMQPSYRAILESDATISGLPLSEQFRKRYVEKQIELAPGARGRPILQRNEGTRIVALMAMVGIILLIACANLAGLLVARGEARQHEIGVRLALGATRARIVRQLLTESFLLTAAAVAAGVALASWILKGLAGPLEDGFDFVGFEARLDFRVLAFAAGLAVITGMLFGLAPALRATRPDVQAALKEQGSNATEAKGNVRTRRGLMISQIALTTMLLCAAGLFVRSLMNLKNVNLGLQTDHVIEFSIAPELNRYTPAQTIALGDHLREGIRALPGVRSVSAAEIRILADTDASSNVTVEGYSAREHEDMNVRTNWVGPSYFATMGTALMSGREFAESDKEGGQKVAIINERMARRFFAGRNPIGLHFAFGSGNEVGPDIEIVGVVQDSKHATVSGDIEPYAYLPYAQFSNLGRLTFYVRTQQDPSALAATLRKTVQAYDSNLPVFDIRTLSEQRDENIFPERLMAALSICFGALASLLAAIGLYGVMAYMVTLRTREIGIRAALGATRGNIAWLILREAIGMSAAGLVAGLSAALATGRLIQSQLFEVKPNDPLALVTAAVLLLAVVILAAWLPARRAMRVDPMVALRYE
jgi:predicted permease